MGSVQRHGDTSATQTPICTILRECLYFLNVYKISNNSASDIVHMVKGDDNGVVNCLEPHPNLPMMATSGRLSL